MSDIKDLLIQAREEIIHLRRRNEILSAKVEMIDLFACILNTRPWAPVEGKGEDVAWKLEQKIREL